MSDVIVPPSAMYRPLYPEDYDQGDPYIFAPPPEARTQFRYYVYTTGEDRVPAGPPGLRVPDLVTWQRLDDALIVGRHSSHWAPCVCTPEVQQPFVMLYSRAVGVGEEGHVGHSSVAPMRPAQKVRSSILTTCSPGISTSPSTPISTAPRRLPATRLRDGLRRRRALWHGHRRGGHRRRSDPPDWFPAHPPRPQYDWHVYEPSRVMPWKTIPGIDWSRHSVRWHTVEAPVGGLVSPQGKRVYLYSGGCFYGFYAVGALVEGEQALRDVTGGEHDFVIGPRPDEGFYALGHCPGWMSYGRDFFLFHARFGAPDAKRQMALAPLRWTVEGLPKREASDG